MLKHNNNYDEKDSKADHDQTDTNNCNKNDNDKDKYKYCPDYDSFLSNIKPKLRDRFEDHLKKRETIMMKAIEKVRTLYILLNSIQCKMEP